VAAMISTTSTCPDCRQPTQRHPWALSAHACRLTMGDGAH
jgi:hypothetical protein